MQYNHYPSTAHHVHPSAHPSQSPNDYPPPYPDQSHHHSAMPYAAVTPASHLPAGSIAPQNIPAQYSYSTYATHSSPDDHHSYYPTSSSQGSAIEQYPSPSSPPSSYATPSHSSHLNSQTSRHHSHLAQPQQFIPTPSQAYQLYSSPGSTSPARPRSSVEPYYHMSPNPQHVVHAPTTSTAHATGGTRSSHPHHANPSAHMSTITATAGERYSCELCDRSFTRLHDRRRHFETVHAASPVLHKCRYCRKDFSRADSLKRHIDNGCDEMPR